MHEFSLAEQILVYALEISAGHGGAPVERVCVEIGALQAVVPESLQFAFEAAVQGTGADGAVLEWREVPAQVECPGCAQVYEAADIVWCCPACGAVGGRAICGGDLVITRVVLSDVVHPDASGRNA